MAAGLAVGNGRAGDGVGPHGSQESGMSKGDISAVGRIIANTINETARGDPDALAARIVAALAEAGYRILPAKGRENAAPRPPRPEPRQLYRSPNADSWFLVRDPATRLGLRPAPGE